MKEKEEKQVVEINKKAKDTFFKLVYESEERRRLLASYLTGLDINDTKIKNVKPVLFGNKENDLAFLCNDTIYFMMEEQSSICKNIPYRLLEYITTGLRTMVSSEDSLYGSTRIMFPLPKLYVANVGLERSKDKLPENVLYDMKLSDSYTRSNMNIEPDLELIVHSVDMRMTYDETLEYIETEKIPNRIIDIEKNLKDYAILANSLRYVQESLKNNSDYRKPVNISDEASLFILLRDRGVFTDLLSSEEVCNVTAAQFSREDIFRSQGRNQGIDEGEDKKLIELICKKIDKNYWKEVLRSRK